MLAPYWHKIERLFHFSGEPNREQWIIISVVVLLVGLVCMKGFGSRSQY
jgi:hypothetical protein